MSAATIAIHERCAINKESVSVWSALVNATATWELIQPALFHLDGEEFIAAAEYHGVLPIAAQRILESPVAEQWNFSAREQLRRAFHANLLRGLPLVDEAVRIVRLFADEDIPIIPYKGPALAEQLWGNSALRKCDDLDFLVERKDVDRSGEILQQLGYARVSPVAKHLRSALLRNASEEQFRHRDSGVLLELQWSPVPRVFAIRNDAERIWRRTERIAFSDEPAIAPSPEDLLMLLSIHGWKHNWSRLIWLGDIAQLTRIYELDWDRLLSDSTANRNRRLLALPLRMVNRIFGTPVPRQFDFVDPELDSLAGELETRLRDANPCSYQDWHRCMLAARDNQFDRARQVATFLSTPGLGEYSACELPRWASPAYRVVRLARLLRLGPRQCGE